MFNMATQPNLEIQSGARSLDALVRRRRFLAESHPECPACGEKHQIQLLSSWPLEKVPPWRCRTCKHGWNWEPPSNGPSSAMGVSEATGEK
jgi:Zn ribbon nucleic-acid-binding protein